MLFASFLGEAQVKLYFSIGTTTTNSFTTDGVYIFGKGHQVFVTDNDYQQKGLGHFINAELIVEKKLNKVIHGVTGISVFQTGYDNRAQYGQNIFLSELDITYVSVPLLLRANFANAVSLDAGFYANFPLTATLDETRNVDTQFELHHSGDIASSLTQLHLGGYAGVTFMVNRYTLGFSMRGGQSKVDDGLADTWPVGDGSLFLRDIYPKFGYLMVMAKVGVRLL